jgi:hypothetical protein
VVEVQRAQRDSAEKPLEKYTQYNKKAGSVEPRTILVLLSETINSE